MAKAPIKVIVLSHSSELSGAERSMLDLFDYWAEKKQVEPYFIIRKPVKNLAKELHRRGWGFTAIYYTNWSTRNPSKKPEHLYRNALINSKAVIKIEEIIRKLQPDMVMTNTIIAPWAAIAAHYQRLPHVWFVREYGDIDHGHIFELGREKTLKDIYTLSALVVANSGTLAKHIKKYINEDKLTTLYTPFNLEYLRQKSLERANNPFKKKTGLKLVITGKVAPSKGQAETAAAIGKLNSQGFDVELCVIGKPIEPADKEPLLKAIKKYGIEDKVHLLGQQANPLSILKYADVGIMASQQEAFGRVTFEYMALGLPVVGSNSGATPELIEDGYNGYLYNQGSTVSLVEKLAMYAKDRDLVKKHGDNARLKADKIVNSKYGSDFLLEKIVEIVANKEKLTPQPLYFTHRWLEFPNIMSDLIVSYDKRILEYRRDIRNIINSKAWKAILLARKILRR